MEAEMNASLRAIVRKGRGLTGLNYLRSQAFVTREKPVVLPECKIMTF